MKYLWTWKLLNENKKLIDNDDLRDILGLVVSLWMDDSYVNCFNGDVVFFLFSIYNYAFLLILCLYFFLLLYQLIFVFVCFVIHWLFDSFSVIDVIVFVY